MTNVSYPKNLSIQVKKSWLAACGLPVSNDEFEIVKITERPELPLAFGVTYEVRDGNDTWTVAHGRTVKLFTSK